MARNHAARKLGNPRLKAISFHVIRHWKSTMEYHKTKDILHVKSLLGHKNIQNTMIYINLERALFREQNNEFTVRAVSSMEEACKLLEVGFEYVCTHQGFMLLRKRK
jgi:integrase